jgi:hypothetical protein
VYRLLVGKPEGKRSLERPRSRRVNNIKMNIVEIEWGEVWRLLGCYVVWLL